MNKESHSKSCLTIGVGTAAIGLIALTMIVALIGCFLILFVPVLYQVITPNEVSPSGDGYFESTGGWDYRRIALIEPYDARNTNNEKPWGVRLQPLSPSGSAAEATKLDVVDKKYIVMYAPNSVLNGKRIDEVWFVIIPAEKITQGFATEAEFLSYLSERGIPEPNMRDVNELYEELIYTGYLPWFPESYKTKP